MTGLMDSIDWGPAVSHYHFLPEYPLWHKDPRAVGWWWPYSQASQVSATGHSPHLDSASLSPIGKRVPIRIKHMEVKALLNTECCVLSHFSCDLWPHGLYLPGSSVHGILQARMLEWVAMSSSRGSSQSRDRTHIPYVYLCWQVGSLPLALLNTNEWLLHFSLEHWGRNGIIKSKAYTFSVYHFWGRKRLPRLILGCQIFPRSRVKIYLTCRCREHLHRRAYFAKLSFRIQVQRFTGDFLCVFLFTSFFLYSADFVLQNQHVMLKMTALTWLGKYFKNTNKKNPACDCDQHAR